MRCLRLLRVMFDISLNELAELSKVSVRELGRIEKSEVAPSRETLTNLDEALLRLVFRKVRDAEADVG